MHLKNAPFEKAPLLQTDRFPYMNDSNKFLKVRSSQALPIPVWKNLDLQYAPLLCREIL